jgi:hypothetical protein
MAAEPYSTPGKSAKSTPLFFISIFLNSFGGSNVSITVEFEIIEGA